MEISQFADHFETFDPNSECEMETEQGDNIVSGLENLALVGEKTEKKISFDEVMGVIERVVVSDEFGLMQSELLKKYYRDIEENEQTYFEEYSNQMTIFFENQIRGFPVPTFNQFSLHKFIDDLKSNSDSLEGEIYEMLLGLRDIERFKELVADYADMMSGKADLILSGITVRPIQIDPEESDEAENVGSN